MKWTDGLTWEEKKKRKEEWHHWFAWYPITIEIKEDRKIKIWLERIERKGYWCSFSGSGWDWEYREIGKKNEI